MCFLRIPRPAWPPCVEIRMPTRYVHTNIVADDWKALVDFYVQVFDCRVVGQERHLTESWLAEGTGVVDAQADGVHLALPGWGDDGPTLEIFTMALGIWPFMSTMSKHASKRFFAAADHLSAGLLKPDYRRVT